MNALTHITALIAGMTLSLGVGLLLAWLFTALFFRVIVPRAAAEVKLPHRRADLVAALRKVGGL
jgi:hypothetical protein